MDCNGMVRTCKGKECEERFKSWNRKNPCPVCGTDRKCGKQAISGYRFCEVHGGPNPRRGFYGSGAAVVTGKNSGFPLMQLAAKNAMLQKNGIYLSNKDSINIVRRRVEQLLERIDENEAPDRLKNLFKLWTQYKRELISNPAQAVFTMALIDHEYEKAYHDYASWEQMFNALRIDKELIESEVKIARELHAIMTAEDANEMIAQIFAIIMNVEQGDHKKLKRYQYEFTRLIGDGSVVDAGRRDGDD